MNDERLRLALEAALHWIETECQPSAEFAGEGHNWNMDADDRARARKIVADGRAALEAQERT